MPAAPTLSVVIPTYAEPQRLARLLRSLSRQRYPAAAAHILVVDDGSPEPIPEDLLTAARPLRTSLLKHDSNRGRAHARNTALYQARGELVVFLDSDMTADPGLLRAHADAHRCGQRRAVIGDIRFAPELGTSSLTRYMDGRGVHRLDANASLPFKCFVTGNSSVPLQLLRTSGFFDPSFSQYGGEDLELGYRLHQLGTDFRYAPLARTHHHHSRTVPELCKLMRVYGRYSMPLLLRKHPELASLLRVDFVRGPGLRPLLVRLALHGAVHHPVRALAGILQAWPLPAVVLDYLIWSARTRAYLAQLSAAENP